MYAQYASQGLDPTPYLDRAWAGALTLMAIVIVTHNMQQAARVSDRTAFFNVREPGAMAELVEYDATARIFSHPARPETADYIAGRFG